MIRIFLSLLTGFALLLTTNCFSQTLWWRGGTSTDWWTASNWSTTDPALGAPTPSGSIPTSSTNVFFNSGAIRDCLISGIDALAEARSITCVGSPFAFTRIFTIGGGRDLTVSGGFLMQGGTFALPGGGSGDTNLIVGAFSQTGGTFNAPQNTATFLVTQSFQHSGGTFNHNNGTLSVQGGTSMTPLTIATGSSTTLRNLAIRPGFISLANSLSILTLGMGYNNAALTLDLNNNTISVGSGGAGMNTFTTTNNSGLISINNGTIDIEGGNLALGNTHNATEGSSGTATLRISAVGNQTMNSTAAAPRGSLPNVLIEKPSGTLSLSGNICVRGNWTYKQGTVSAGTSTVYFRNSGSYSIDSEHLGTTMRFHHLSTNSGTASLSSALDLSGNFTVANTTTFQTNNWPIDLSGNFTVANTATFTAGTGDVELKGPGDQVISTLSNFYTLTINNTSGIIILNSPVQITSQLNLGTGIIYCASPNNLYLTDGATVTPGHNASYVDGPVYKTGDEAFTFPLGKGGYYRPISISAPMPPNPTDQFSAEYFETPYVNLNPVESGLSHVTNCDHWILNRTAGTSSVAVTLSWNDVACVGTTFNINNSFLANLRVARWDGTSWKNEGNASITGDATAGTITSNLVGSFSPFALATTTVDNMLPVELTEFTAEQYGSSILLKWHTASELNNDYFSIEHYSPGQEFVQIGKVNGEGTTTEPHNYSFIHRGPHAGDNFYRLVQYDFDLKKQYSKVVHVVSSESGPWQIEGFPNPVRTDNDLKIRSSRFLQNVKLTLRNSFSNTVALEREFQSFGWEQSIQVANLAPGFYYLLISSKEGIVGQKIAVIR